MKLLKACIFLVSSIFLLSSCSEGRRGSAPQSTEKLTLDTETDSEEKSPQAPIAGDLILGSSPELQLEGSGENEDPLVIEQICSACQNFIGHLELYNEETRGEILTKKLRNAIIRDLNRGSAFCIDSSAIQKLHSHILEQLEISQRSAFLDVDGSPDFLLEESFTNTESLRVSSGNFLDQLESYQEELKAHKDRSSFLKAFSNLCSI